MDSDPTEFNYDFIFKAQEKLTLDPANFPSLKEGYSIAIYQKLYDEPKNTFQSGSLKVTHQSLASLATFTMQSMQNVKDAIEII